MTLIMRAQSDEWPSRLAWKVVKELMIKYKPNDNMARVEVRMMLNKVSMKNDDNPSVLFKQISQIQNQFGMVAHTIEDRDFIPAATAAVPNKYQCIVAAEQQIRGGELMLNHLEDAMQQFYQQTSLDKGKDGGKGNTGKKKEMMLNAFDGIFY